MRGFTLFEVVLAVAVISLLAAFAVPSYQEHVRKSRRVDAISELERIASEQRRFFTDNNRYARTFSELGFGAGGNRDSNGGFYTVTMASPTPASFIATATPKPDGPQADDDRCGALSLSSTGARGAAGTAGVSACW